MPGFRLVIGRANDVSCLVRRTQEERIPNGRGDLSPRAAGVRYKVDRQLPISNIVVPLREEQGDAPANFAPMVYQVLEEGDDARAGRTIRLLAEGADGLAADDLFLVVVET